ncbi:STAS domain-containing protein [Antrihabitans sp. YC3-6]|uniref:Anti-sigma factor antagonist n=1 Tax=Antrihabitans stalagmiti TaxID=2799499 RepID=A0A934U669_9NOCA|nr:STAS domain-containing protein [Antrihabitans stalagmiti]MBJ8341613.1 STAS domain-containing protein [Antrihabitans stalagmiti]
MSTTNDESTTNSMGSDSISVEVSCTKDGTVVVRIVGDIDMATQRHLRTRFDETFAEFPSPKAVLVDLAEITFFGSAGIELLVALAERSSTRGHPFRIVTGNNRAVIRPLEVTGLDRSLDLVPTFDAAYALPPPGRD